MGVGIPMSDLSDLSDLYLGRLLPIFAQASYRSKCWNTGQVKHFQLKN